MIELSPAERLVAARRRATGLAAFPGPLPQTLAEAYAMQAEAVAGWGDAVAGWKIGRITGEDAQRHGRDRFIGPMFAGTVSRCDDAEPAAFPVIAGGSSALEAELVAVLGADIPAGKDDWTPDHMAALIGSFHVGIEVAGCPVAGVGELGPLATIAAFGNNLALLLGPEIPAWRERDIDAIACRASIDGVEVGQAVAGALPGGVWTAISFALNQAAELGIPLTRGMLLSTGAITGVHAVTIGQRCAVDFGAFGTLHCDTAAAG